MASRINGGSIGQNPFGTQYPTTKGSAETQDSVGRQVEDSLFGRPAPDIIEPDEEAAALLSRLDGYRKKLARLATDAEEDYRLALSSTTIASIDIHGVIYVGRTFLFQTAESLPLQVGVLAHEIGHRPQRWKEYRSSEALAPRDLADLCRLEETRADYFSGFALAHLRFDCEPVCGYLYQIQVHPHPEYFSPAMRAKTIREGFEYGRRRQSNLQKFFPELARMSSVAHDLGKA